MIYGGMSLRQRIILSGVWAALGLMVGLSGIAFFWVLDTGSPIQIVYSHPTPVTPDTTSRENIKELRQAKPGDVIYTWREWCIKDPRTHALGTLHRSLTDTVVYTYPDAAPRLSLSRTNVPEPACLKRVVAIQLPPRLPPGFYRYTVTAEYIKNPLRTLLVPWPDVEFEVIP